MLTLGETRVVPDETDIAMAESNRYEEAVEER